MSHHKILYQTVFFFFFFLICRNVEEIRNLNWAKFVLDFLIQSVRKHKDTNLVAINGCALLLMEICSK